MYSFLFSDNHMTNKHQIMKMSEELVASSVDFNSTNVQVLLCKEDNYLCVLANRKVGHATLKINIILQ